MTWSVDLYDRRGLRARRPLLEFGDSAADPLDQHIEIRRGTELRGDSKGEAVQVRKDRDRDLIGEAPARPCRRPGNTETVPGPRAASPERTTRGPGASAAPGHRSPGPIRRRHPNLRPVTERHLKQDASPPRAPTLSLTNSRADGLCAAHRTADLYVTIWQSRHRHRPRRVGDPAASRRRELITPSGAGCLVANSAAASRATSPIAPAPIALHGPAVAPAVHLGGSGLVPPPRDSAAAEFELGDLGGFSSAASVCAAGAARLIQAGMPAATHIPGTTRQGPVR